MEPEPGKEKERTIKTLEQDLNDLRQGLTVVAEFYKDLEAGSKEKDASLALDEGIVKPLMEDELEFESIWSFHEEVLWEMLRPMFPAMKCTRHFRSSAPGPAGPGWTRKPSSLSLPGWRIPSPGAITGIGSGTGSAPQRNERNLCKKSPE